MPAINFTMFLDEIRKGEKLQTIRLHRCKIGHSCVLLLGIFAHTPYRQSWLGKTIKLYTGMRRKGKKAELLGIGICTEVELKRFGELTEEDAERDGFKRGYQPGICERVHNGCHGRFVGCMADQERCTPLNKLWKFLYKTYKAQPDTLFEIIRWKLKEVEA